MMSAVKAADGDCVCGSFICRQPNSQDVKNHAYIVKAVKALNSDEFKTTVRDQDTNEKHRLTFTNCNGCGVLLHVKGYGDKCSDNGKGYPVMIEVYEGKLRVIIWADINEEEPTHTIELDGAMESKRKD